MPHSSLLVLKQEGCREGSAKGKAQNGIEGAVPRQVFSKIVQGFGHVLGGAIVVGIANLMFAKYLLDSGGGWARDIRRLGSRIRTHPLRHSVRIRIRISGAKTER